MDLPNNTEYLIDMILPRLQEVQRDIARNKCISCEISTDADCGLMTMYVHLYDKDGMAIKETKMFDFFSHDSVSRICEKYDNLKTYIVDHQA